MEHRYSDRMAADLNIVIYKKNLLVAIGIIKNVGKEGVFIESLFSELTANQPLEIEFFANDSALKNRRFKAVVVHRTEQGFGAEIENIAEKIRLGLPKNPARPAKNSALLNDVPNTHGGRSYAAI